jgi:hypothetical protein
MSGWVYGPGGGGSTSPGGSNGDIQFNSSGSFSGSALLTTDGAGSLSASANISASAFYGDGSNLTGVTASAVEVADGPQYSLQFRYDSPVSGDLSGSANFVVSSDMSKLFITGSTILAGALSSSDIVPLADEQYDIGQEGLGYENAYINFLNGGVAFTVQNDEGATISKGDVVYIKGISGGNPTVGLAACDEAAKMPAFGFVADGNIVQGSTGRVVTLGRLNGINTTAFSEGDVLYVQTGSGGTSGSVTNTPPTGSGNLLQNIGKVTEAAASGQIRVGGAGRTNATPNLDKGHIFVGNETDQAIQDNTIFVSASAERVGINKTVPTAALHVSASSVHGGESARFEGQVVITSPDGELIVQDTDSNKQIRATAATVPTLEFGNSVSDTWEYFYLQGGTTSKIITKSNLNAFIISDTSAGTEGITYKPTQARVGINTPLPSHAFTVNGDTYVTGAISASVGVSSSQVEVGSAYVGDVSANGVVVGFTDGQLVSHGNFTFASDVLSVPTITASVGIQTEALEVSSSANGSINIGEGIKYTFNGVDRLDAFEGEFKLREVTYYKALSPEQTTDFAIRNYQTFIVNCTGSVITGSLPDLSTADDIGLTFTVKDLYGSGSTNNIHITSSATPGQLIDGGNALKIEVDYGAVTLTALSSSRDGYGWGIVSAT